MAFDGKECVSLLCKDYGLAPLCFCSSVSPVGLQVSQASLQVVEQIHFLAALRAVDVQQLAVIQLPHLLRSLPRTATQREHRSTGLKGGCDYNTLEVREVVNTRDKGEQHIM